MKKQTMRLQSADDVVRLRKTSRELADSLGFGVADKTRLVTAISEVSREVLQNEVSWQCEIINQSGFTGKCILVEMKEESQVGRSCGKMIQRPQTVTLLAGDTPIEEQKKSQCDDRAITTGVIPALGGGISGAKRLIHTVRIENTAGLATISLLIKQNGGGARE